MNQHRSTRSPEPTTADRRLLAPRRGAHRRGRGVLGLMLLTGALGAGCDRTEPEAGVAGEAAPPPSIPLPEAARLHASKGPAPAPVGRKMGKPGRERAEASAPAEAFAAEARPEPEGGAAAGDGAGYGLGLRGTATKSGIVWHDEPRRSRAEADEDARARAEERQIAAGQLTAGILDDLADPKLLDELRERVAGRADVLSAAIPDHKARGPAPGTAGGAKSLEIAFALDTTGSMGDELRYLKAEIRGIAGALAADYPDLTQRYALVAYRDHGDSYVEQHYDFASLDAFVDRLDPQFADGGGDFPEAMDRGMQAASELSWSDRGAAKVLFVVADAPPHPEGYEGFARAVGALARQEVSVVPVASSGVEQTCEYLMRWAARTTGGKYLFLTDHSGIGNPHATPHAPQYELKSLRAHLLDVIRAELRPIDVGPIAAPPVIHVAPPAPAPVEVVAVQLPPAEESWLERHALLFSALGGLFLLGFGVDMARTAVRARRRGS